MTVTTVSLAELHARAERHGLQPYVRDGVARLRIAQRWYVASLPALADHG